LTNVIRTFLNENPVVEIGVEQNAIYIGDKLKGRKGKASFYFILILCESSI